MATAPSNPDAKNVVPSKHIAILRFPSIALDNSAVAQALGMDIPVTQADIDSGGRADAKERFALVPIPRIPGLSLAMTTEAGSNSRFPNTEAALAEEGFAFDLDGYTPDSNDFHLYWRPSMDSQDAQSRSEHPNDAITELEHFAQARMQTGQPVVGDRMQMN